MNSKKIERTAVGMKFERKGMKENKGKWNQKLDHSSE
jgi:hypothetical protein